jgi:hypothetical protein
MSPRELDDETKHIAATFDPAVAHVDRTRHTHDPLTTRARSRAGARGPPAPRCAALSRRSGPASDVRRTRGSRGAARRRLAPAGPTLNLSAKRAGRTRDDRSLNHAPTERVRPRPTTRAASGGCAQPCRSCGHGCMRHKLQTEPQAGRGRNLRHPVYLLVQHTRPVHLAAGCIMCRSRPAVAPLSTARRENNCPIGNCPIGPSPPAERGELFRAPGARQ